MQCSMAKKKESRKVAIEAVRTNRKRLLTNESPWMVCENRQKYLKYLYVSAAALNVVLNLALIPSWGASGAAAASLITQASTTVILPAIIRPLRPNCRLMLDAVLFRGVFPEKNESTARRNWR